MPLAQRFLPRQSQGSQPPQPPQPSQQLAVSGSPPIAALTPASTKDSASQIWQSVLHAESHEMQVFFLRHTASIARRRNAYHLMEAIVRVCKEKSIDLNTVISPPSDGLVADPGASTHPFEILQMVSASRGYCQARTIGPHGRNAYFNNGAFEHDILSVEACNSAYERNEVELMALLMHPDDLAAVHDVIARVWTLAARKDGGLATDESRGCVRVRNRRLQTYLDCTLRVSMVVQRERDIVSGAFELLPRDDAGAAAPALAESAGPVPLVAARVDSSGSLGDEEFLLSALAGAADDGSGCFVEALGRELLGDGVAAVEPLDRSIEYATLGLDISTSRLNDF